MLSNIHKQININNILNISAQDLGLTFPCLLSLGIQYQYDTEYQSLI